MKLIRYIMAHTQDWPRENNIVVYREDELKPVFEAIRKSLYNVPRVGDKYDQQHSDIHMRTTLEIEAILNNMKGA